MRLFKAHISICHLMFRGILHNPTLLNMAKDEKGIVLDMWIFSKVSQEIFFTMLNLGHSTANGDVQHELHIVPL